MTSGNTVTTRLGPPPGPPIESRAAALTRRVQVDRRPDHRGPRSRPGCWRSWTSQIGRPSPRFRQRDPEDCDSTCTTHPNSRRRPAPSLCCVDLACGGALRSPLRIAASGVVGITPFGAPGAFCVRVPFPTNWAVPGRDATSVSPQRAQGCVVAGRLRVDPVRVSARVGLLRRTGSPTDLPDRPCSARPVLGDATELLDGPTSRPLRRGQRREARDFVGDRLAMLIRM